MSDSFAGAARRIWWKAPFIRGGLPLLLVFAILLPALVASLILWQTLTKQIYASYEKRLATGLQTFELILSGSHRTLQDTVSRTAADNTMRITMELEILPQLRRYLQSQNEVSSIDFLTVTKPDHTSFFSNSSKNINLDMSGRQCKYSRNGPIDNLALIDNTLILSRSHPVVHNDQILGFVCGAMLLNDPAYLSKLMTTLNAQPILWHDGYPAPSASFDGQQVNSLQDPGQMLKEPDSHHAIIWAER